MLPQSPPTSGGIAHSQLSDNARRGTLNTLRRAIFLVSLPFGILHFVLPIYGKSIGANAVQIGLFFSVFSLMTVLLRPAVGVALDRYGRRPFFIAGLVGYALTMMAFAFAERVWAIVAARTFQGAASACLWLAADALTADVAPTDGRGRAFGRLAQANMQGALLGTFIGFGLLVSLNVSGGWMPLFLTYGLVSLAAAGLAWRRLPETNPGFRRVSSRTVVWSRPMILLLLVTAVTGASWAMVSPILMIYLQEKLAVGVMELASAYIPAALVWAILPARLGRLADRFGRKPLMVLGMAVAAASSFLIPGLGSLWALATLWALQALCYAAGDPAEQALVADLTGDDQRGRAYGFYALAAGLGATLGPLLGGWMYEALGPQAPFYANGIILAFSTLLLGLLLQVPENPQSRPSQAAGGNE